MSITGLNCVAAEQAQQDVVSAGEQPQAEEQFDIWEIRVLGNTVLPSARIESAIYPFLGSGRTIGSVEKARVALEAAYRDAGFGTVFIDIPEQTIDSGIVRLNVTEGRLERVRITGARYYSNRQIRTALPALEKDAVMHLPSLQEELVTLNRQARDRQVTPVMRAGRSPGTVDVELKVQDSAPVHATLEVNDRHTANTSETRASATLNYDNLWQRFHSLSLQYQTAPEEPDEARVIAATYVAPMQSTGHMIAAFAVDTDSEFTTLGAEFAELGVIGKGRVYGLRYVIPLPETSGYYHSFTLGSDYKDFSEVILQDDGTPASTPISYMNWSATYAGTYRTERTLTSFDVGANFGIRGFANSEHEFYFKRFSGTPNKGDPGYFYITAGARHERPLWLGLIAYTELAGQYSPHALISNEQFSIGGAESVRGYMESEELGDYGARATVELRLPLLRSWLGDRVDQFYLSTFYDAGVIALQHALDQQDPRIDLSSWGAGLRFAGFGLQAELDWAYPLVSSSDTLRGDSRIHFRVRYGF